MKYYKYFVSLMKVTRIPGQLYVFFSLLGGLLGIYFYHGNKNIYVPLSQVFFLQNYNYRFFATLFVFCIPIVVSVYFCKIYFDEIDVYPFLFSKMKSRRFQYLRLISTFTQAFLLIFIFLISNLLVVYLSNKTNNTALYNVSDSFRINIIDNSHAFYLLFINNPLMFTLLYILLLSIYSGFSAMFSYSVGVYTNNKTSAYLSGFLFSILFILIASFFDNGIVVWYPQNIFLPFSMRATNPGFFTLYKGIISIILTYMIITIIIIKKAFKSCEWYD